MRIKNQKGFIFRESNGMTIIELLVAMSIFIIVVTLAVGGFISLIRLQSQTESMADVQQNGRIIIEQITRMAREAESLKISDTGNNDIKELTINNETCLRIENERLKKFTPCASTDGLTLSDDGVKITKFYFEKVAGLPSALNIFITIESKDNISGGDTDKLELNSSVLLTSIK